MNQSDDFGKILKLWPNLVDHYICTIRWPRRFQQLVSNLPSCPSVRYCTEKPPTDRFLMEGGYHRPVFVNAYD